MAGIIRKFFFFWLTHSVYSSYSKSNFHKWNYIYICICVYIYILEVLGWGDHSLFVPFPTSLQKKDGEEKHKACNRQCAFMSLPTQTTSIMLMNTGQSLITWTPAGGRSLAEDTVQGRACFPFQFLLKINHLSKLNVRGWVFCLNSKLVRRLIKASVCCEWIVKRQISPF